MAVEKIILASKDFKNNWWTVSDNNGRVINISTINKKSQQAENQKLASILANANPGDEIEIDIRLWEGKFYGNDPKSGGGTGKSFTPADKSFQAAIAASQAVGQMLALTSKDITTDQFDKLFEHIHAKIMSKKSA